ncbi:hypothetical protein L2E82_29596 [Cichorium intybus]|uniref:Uncharacterized protein n=1 Tax=Cichorium intybus TaxID=13427 RepID=A0ACB9CYN1_CICIN|nr:hypothetical protein L2E82_29596 [Cichorium intybus]
MFLGFLLFNKVLSKTRVWRIPVSRITGPIQLGRVMVCAKMTNNTMKITNLETEFAKFHEEWQEKLPTGDLASFLSPFLFNVASICLADDVEYYLELAILIMLIELLITMHFNLLNSVGI